MNVDQEREESEEDGHSDEEHETIHEIPMNDERSADDEASFE
jgi:hypothetical protein